eukprot:TRINITY_DN4032_c0_g3_i1.p1 TRINITY_DN4032_c0_g3~~TRINITY_DN4032_c0_g3_i1.p1  ORF type:complete len:102 (-),score=24.78 TRINITY_DN4032_c0_g3_i1:483-788(-)
MQHTISDSNSKNQTMGKTVEKTGKPKARKAKRHESYSIYIHKVLKKVHDEVGISKRGMAIMESFISDMFERITVEAGKMCRYGKKSTLSSRELSVWFFQES